MEGRRQLQVLPFPIIESAGGYHALVRREQAKKPKVARFLAWLETEAADLKGRAQA
jgi:DNA-binding transcriptional LysR family regulator